MRGAVHEGVTNREFEPKAAKFGRVKRVSSSVNSVGDLAKRDGRAFGGRSL